MNALARIPPEPEPKRSDQGPPTRACTRGFTLVEVLITAGVTLIAFVGLATVQMLGLRAATSSFERSQATVLAYDIVDRMRLNRENKSSPGDSALGGGYDNARLCGKTCSVGSAITSPTGFSNPDTPTANSNLSAWWNAIDRSGLPNWFAGIAHLPQQTVFTVSVQWDDARAENGSDDQEATRPSCLGTDLSASTQEVCVMTQL